MKGMKNNVNARFNSSRMAFTIGEDNAIFLTSFNAVSKVDVNIWKPDWMAWIAMVSNEEIRLKTAENMLLMTEDVPPSPSSSLSPDPNIDVMKLNMESKIEEIMDIAEETRDDRPLMILIVPEKGSSSISPIPLMIAEYAVPRAPPNWEILETMDVSPLARDDNPFASPPK